MYLVPTSPYSTEQQRCVCVCVCVCNSQFRGEKKEKNKKGAKEREREKPGERSLRKDSCFSGTL